MSYLNQKVFIVDDEPLLSEMLTDYLLNHHPNLIITSFLTGEECLKNLYENPAIIILDYHLNSKKIDAANGIDILKEIKQQNKTTPVIMLSSQDSYTKAAQTIGLGAVHYVIKGHEAFEEIQKLIEANI
ncbi:MAG: two-component system OmpR family response regulator [Patiriisocius sp.]|jgi:DNA-binding NarL/FixJ family response regulator